MPSGDNRDLVFVSYSHASSAWLDRLLTLLKPFSRSGGLTIWADSYIKTGEVWRREIDAALRRTRVGVVLLTNDLLASDFVANVEIPALLRGARTQALRLVVVPIEPYAPGATRFADGDLADYQWSLAASRPLGALRGSRRIEALVEVCSAILEAAGLQSVADHSTEPPHRSATSRVVSGRKLGSLFWVPAPPPNYQPRTAEHRQLVAAILGTSAVVGLSAVSRRVGVRGQGGIGKTVLACALVHDGDVRRAFPDGIFWITVGQQPRLEAAQAQLAGALGQWEDVEDVPHGVRLLADRFAHKAYLLVLDDVWELSHAKAFDVAGGSSRLLITTRDRSVLTALGAEDIAVGVLAPADAVQLLCRWANTPMDSAPVEAAYIVSDAGYLPLAIALAGAQIRDGRSWADVLDALRRGDLAYLDHPYDSVLRSIHASVQALSSSDAARYLDLAVFPDTRAIPVDAIATLWKETGHLDPLQTRTLLARLATKHLVAFLPGAMDSDRPHIDAADASSPQKVAMHDLLSDYVRLFADDVPRLHRQLIDGFRARIPWSLDPLASSWTHLPTASDYAWKFLPYHLKHAGRHDELRGLLFDQNWLLTRLRMSPVATIVTDYHLIDDARATILRDALLLSAHILAKDPGALPSQLAGRLFDVDDPDIKRVTTSIPDSLRSTPLLLPVSRALTRPGGPLLRTLEGHRGGIGAISIVPGGHWAISASDDHTLKVWDISSGTPVHGFDRHSHWLRSVAALPNGRHAISACAQYLRVWELSTGDEISRIPAERHAFRAIALLPGGDRVVTVATDGTIRVYSLATGRPTITIDWHGSSGRVVAPLRDGHGTIVGYGDGAVRLWDIEHGTLTKSLGQTDASITAVAVSDDRAFTGDEAGRIQAWDLRSGRLIRTWAAHDGIISGVAAPPNSPLFASTGRDGTVKLWTHSLFTLHQLLETDTRDITALAVFPDGRYALTGSEDGALKYWDLSKGGSQGLHSHRGRVRAVAVSSDSQLSASGGDDGALRLWTASSKDRITIEPFEWRRPVECVAFSADGKACLVGDWTGVVTVVAVDSRTVIHRLGQDEFEAGRPGDAASSPTQTTGKVVAIWSPRKTEAIVVTRVLSFWNIDTGLLLRAFQLPGHASTSSAALIDDASIACGREDGQVDIWDLTSGRLLGRYDDIHTKAVRALTVLPGERLALSTGSNQAINMWNVDTGLTQAVFHGHDSGVTALAAIRGGRFLSASADRTIKLWDIRSRVPIATFYGDASFHSVACSDDGARIVAGDALGRVHLIRLRS
jgi:WD40 repeat protein